MMDMHDGAGPMMSGMWFFSILFWIVLIAGVVFLVRWLMERNKRGTSLDASALEILKRRYARGEIDRETFEQMKKELDDEIS